MFEPVPKSFDVPGLERDVIRFWDENDIERRYLARNAKSREIFRFIDGPITANGPMGVHHAWGRTYKDLWQRYNTMLGKRQRYQNGFDCQGLWVEVTVERELGFTSKLDIERLGTETFVRKCKESVYRFAAMQTSQSRRLGYFMDWDNSYYTLSDGNNYTIWHFLKVCHERDLLYRGHDVMPWCVRCGTGISDAEAAEGYQDLKHRSVYVRFPLVDRPGESLLVWTTTPWTLTSNVAVAVSPDLTYVKARQGEEVVYVAKEAMAKLGTSPAAGSTSAEGPTNEVLEEVPGSALLNLRYRGPFDELPAVAGVNHVVIPWDEVSEDEGTGLVHIAPGCGKEDFSLAKQYGLQVIAPLDQYGVYGDGFGWLTGRNVLEVGDEIVEDLRRKGLLYRAQSYTHRYPTCWRCGTELVFRLVDEWFISMDPLREPMMDAVRRVRWIPPYGLDREIDWLRNMGDWMISKKRYWGLALPFWICPNNHLQVVGGREELFEKAIDGLEHLESPHRPWIDQVHIRCSDCGEPATRIPDVGNPWLDAGIVPFSTLGYLTDREYWREWFPAEFITESFPGQFRNWFYSMLAMSTVLENTNPFETVLGYALLRDRHGREMHKSWGNLIPFDEAADRAGADMMRWLFCQHNPEQNLNFGYESLDEVKRRLLILWNTYSFFVLYANADGWAPNADVPEIGERPILDRWILARLHQTTRDVRAGLDRYDATGPARTVEHFIDDLSTWYLRRTRPRFWKGEKDADKAAAYSTLYQSLTTLTRLLAPFMPFVAESLYQNLVRRSDAAAPLSVHLTDFPVEEDGLIDADLLDAMAIAQHVVGLGRAARERANIRVRQPLARLYLRAPAKGLEVISDEVRSIVLEELNVRDMQFARPDEEFATYVVRPNLPALGPRYGKLLPRLRAALEACDSTAVARAVEAGESVRLDVDGQAIELLPGDVLVSSQERPGYAAMSSDGFLVALDTRLTDELIAEGLSREVVRRINEWRKAAGLRVEDRITARFEATPRLAAATEAHAEYIQQETLCVSLERGLRGSGFKAETEFGGEQLQVEIERVDVGRGQ